MNKDMFFNLFFGERVYFLENRVVSYTPDNRVILCTERKRFLMIEYQMLRNMKTMLDKIILVLLLQLHVFEKYHFDKKNLINF